RDLRRSPCAPWFSCRGHLHEDLVQARQRALEAADRAPLADQLAEELLGRAARLEEDAVAGATLDHRVAVERGLAVDAHRVVGMPLADLADGAVQHLA